MESQVLHTVWCTIPGEAAGEIWNWSLLGVKGLNGWESVLFELRSERDNGADAAQQGIDPRRPAAIWKEQLGS